MQPTASKMWRLLRRQRQMSWRLGTAVNEPGSKLPLLYSSKEGCSMSRDMLKPCKTIRGTLKNDTP